MPYDKIQHRARLQDALIAAFTLTTFAKVVNSIFSGEEIYTSHEGKVMAVIKVLNHAEAQEQVEQFVAIAQRGSENSQLRAIAIEIGLPPTPPPPSPDQTPSAKRATSHPAEPAGPSPSTPDKRMPLDVFISCCPTDQQWVNQTIIPDLKRAGLSYNSLSVGQSGGAIQRANQPNPRKAALLASRKLLLILSLDFLNHEHAIDDINAIKGLSIAKAKEFVIKAIIDPRVENNMKNLPNNIKNAPLIYITKNQSAKERNNNIQVLLNHLPPPSANIVSHQEELSSSEVEQEVPASPTQQESSTPVRSPVGIPGSLLNSAPKPPKPSSLPVEPPRNDQKKRLVSKTLFEVNTGDFVAVAWSQDKKHLALAYRDNMIQIWDIANQQNIQLWRPSVQSIAALAWSADGKRLAIADKQDVSIWNVDLSIPTKALLFNKHQALVTALAWSSEQDEIASADEQYNVLIWNANAGTIISRYEGHKAELNSGHDINVLAWGPGEKIASGRYQKVHIWGKRNTTTFKKCDVANGIQVMAWSPDHQYIAAASQQFIYVFSANGAFTSQYKAHRSIDTIKSVTIDTLAWAPNSTHIVSGGSNTLLNIWQINDTKCLYECTMSQDVVTVLWPEQDSIIALSGNSGVVSWQPII